MNAELMFLAAGLGTRLWPLTLDRAKPAVPFRGRPLILGLAEWIAKQGARELVVNTHHLPASIHAALTPGPPGLRIHFSHEAEILGTAGGIARARDLGLLTARAPLVVVNAKLHTELDLGALLAAHERSGAKVTMVLKPNRAREAFREVLVDGDRIVGFGSGRLPTGPDPLLFTGIHVLAPEVVAGLEARFSDTVADVYPRLIAARAVHAHVAEDLEWLEFSTLERYVELHASAGVAAFASPGAVVEPGARVRGAVLWEGARVEAGATVEEAVLGPEVVVPAGETVRREVVMLAARVPEAERGRGVVEGPHFRVRLGPA